MKTNKNLFVMSVCPHCKGEIIVPACDTCIHPIENISHYKSAIACNECGIFHKNYFPAVFG